MDISIQRLGSLLLVAATVLLTAVGSRAQTGVDTVSSLPGIQIKTSVDRAQIFVGDRIAYAITITYDSIFELIPPPLGANLGAFEVKDYEPDVTTTLKNGKIQSVTKFVLSTFTTGEYVIPPLPVIFRLPDSSSKALLAEGVPISVKSLLGEGKGADSLDIKPLKSQFAFRDVISATYYRIAGAVLLLLAMGVVWFFARRRRAAVAYVDPRTPWEIAFEDLALLAQKQLVESGEYRVFYFELTEIARAFLGRIYTIDVLEMTTSEFIARFAETGLPGQRYPELVEFLKHADLVKFARYTPEPKRAEEDSILVHDMIADVRDDFLRRQQAELQVHKAATETAAGDEEKAA